MVVCHAPMIERTFRHYLPTLIQNGSNLRRGGFCFIPYGSLLSKAGTSRDKKVATRTQLVFVLLLLQCPFYGEFKENMVVKFR